MVFWKSPLAGIRCENRHLYELGKPDQLLGSAGVEHALSSMDDRTLRLEQQLGDGTDVGRIGRRADALWRRVLELARHLAVADLRRQLDQHRSGLAGAEVVERAPHQLDGTARLADFRGPLHHWPEILHRIERRRREAAADAVAGDQQNRHVIAEHLGRAGKRVLDAGPALHRKHAGPLTIGRATDAVGDSDTHPFLPTNDRPDADLGAEIDQRLTRVANQVLDALFLEDARNRLGNLHVTISPYSAA